jgi:hypothetical protein
LLADDVKPLVLELLRQNSGLTARVDELVMQRGSSPRPIKSGLVTRLENQLFGSQSQVKHPVISLMAATLDGRDRGSIRDQVHAAGIVLAQAHRVAEQAAIGSRGFSYFHVFPCTYLRSLTAGPPAFSR